MIADSGGFADRGPRHVGMGGHARGGLSRESYPAMGLGMVPARVSAGSGEAGVGVVRMVDDCRKASCQGTATVANWR